jgi:hypothetical protein
LRPKPYQGSPETIFNHPTNFRRHLTTLHRNRGKVTALSSL